MNKLNKKLSTLFIITLYSFSLNADEWSEGYQNQSPSQCINYNHLANFGETILPCFSFTLGRNKTNQSIIRDAYRQFHALNWSVLENHPKIVNYNFDYINEKDSNPVWQSWPTNINIRPQTDFKKNRLECIKKTTKKRIEKFKDKNIKHPIFLEIYTNPQGNTLKDKDKNHLYYSTHYNNVAYNHLKKGNKDVPFPVGSEENKTRGAIIAKAAWIFEPANAKELYHRAAAYIFKTDGKSSSCNLKVVALAALHIVSKNNPTPYIVKPDVTEKINMWSWATYINTNVVPSFEKYEDIKLHDTIGFPLFDWKGSLKKCVTSDSIIDINNKGCKINKPSCTNEKCSRSSIIELISTEDKELLDYYNNKTKLMLKDSVWSNYRIINSQWEDMGITKPTYLSNPILEPFEGETSSCSACHRKANDFIFSFNKNTH